MRKNGILNENILRLSEITPYANVILQSGVNFS
jgi:D-ribose pyranose/furanose isomerase RbsD